MSTTHGKINKLTETEKAYIAGMLDADGSVGITRRLSTSEKYPFDFASRVIITNGNYDLILWLKDTIGAGCAYQYKKSGNENWNLVHRYQITNEKCKALLEQILPYMIVKKQKAMIAISLPTREMAKGRNGRDNETYAIQWALWEQLFDLNRRGRQVDLLDDIDS